MIEIRRPSFHDLRLVSGRLRTADREELSLTRDLSAPHFPTRLAADAWRSKYREMAYLDGEPVFAFGVALAPSGKGQAWGFGTDKSAKVLTRVTKYLRKSMIPRLVADGLTVVQAIGDPGNFASARWLPHLGFKPIANLAGIGAGGHDLILWVTTAADARSACSRPIASAA